mmetsp:Transcript_59318/g.145073  ORF Transcript_59318/g.145073 Transcript_59318/m.145073 type:complete len:243 (+) Transcript_59318:5436-6164(+)
MPRELPPPMLPFPMPFPPELMPPMTIPLLLAPGPPIELLFMDVFMETPICAFIGPPPMPLLFILPFIDAAFMPPGLFILRLPLPPPEPLPIPFIEFPIGLFICPLFIPMLYCDCCCWLPPPGRDDDEDDDIILPSCGGGGIWPIPPPPPMFDAGTIPPADCDEFLCIWGGMLGCIPWGGWLAGEWSGGWPPGPPYPPPPPCGPPPPGPGMLKLFRGDCMFWYGWPPGPPGPIPDDMLRCMPG